jgi:hypothetical protein
MGAVMGSLQELKGSLEGVAASLEAKLPQPVTEEG